MCIRDRRYIYQRTALPELVGALDNPEGRLANLNLLIGYARTYENAGYRTLSQFLRFLEEVESAGDDLSPADVYKRQQDESVKPEPPVDEKQDDGTDNK